MNTKRCIIKNILLEIQTNPDALEQVISASTLVPSSVGLSGPMNSSWPMKSYNAQRIGRTLSSTTDNPGIEKWRFQSYIMGVDSGAAVADDGTIYFGSEEYVCIVSKWHIKMEIQDWYNRIRLQQLPQMELYTSPP